MKIFQTVAGIDKASGGPSYTVPSLCSNMSAIGADVELHILKSKFNENFDKKSNFKIFAHRRDFPSKLGFSRDMKEILLAKVKSDDVIHTHGLWLMPNILSYIVANKVGAKFVLSPEGMLTEWSLNRSKLKKQFIGKLGQYKAILNADCIHVTAESEYFDVRNFGYKGPISIIPNGVHIPDVTLGFEQKCGTPKRLIFISRVHPKKGIELLLKAWSIIYKSFPDWELDICGPGDLDYINKIKRDIAAIPNSRAQYIQPIYDQNKQDFYNSASLFVLPTHSENFGVVVAEALSSEVPVIVSKGAPWRGVLDNSCGWWIDNTVDELVNTLSHAFSLSPQTLNDMGKRGRTWMKNDFSWNSISKNMLSTYHWLNLSADKPDFIRLD